MRNSPDRGPALVLDIPQDWITARNGRLEKIRKPKSGEGKPTEFWCPNILARLYQSSLIGRTGKKPSTFWESVGPRPACTVLRSNPNSKRSNEKSRTFVFANG